MPNLTKTQTAALATATERVVQVWSRGADGYVDYSLPTTTVTATIIRGHRNGIHSLIRQGYATGNLKALGDDHAILTDAGLALL